jgi:hypothetical protein
MIWRMRWPSRMISKRQKLAPSVEHLFKDIDIGDFDAVDVCDQVAGPEAITACQSTGGNLGYDRRRAARTEAAADRRFAA